MALVRNLLTYGSLITTLGLGCVRSNDLAKTEVIEKLPLEEIYLAPEIDLDKDDDLETIVIGKLKANYRDSNGKIVDKDKCAMFLLDNLGDKYKIKRVGNLLDRYPEILNEGIGSVKGLDYKWSLEKISKKKVLLTLDLEKKRYKKVLSWMRKK